MMQFNKRIIIKRWKSILEEYEKVSCAIEKCLPYLPVYFRHLNALSFNYFYDCLINDY